MNFLCFSHALELIKSANHNSMIGTFGRLPSVIQKAFPILIVDETAII